MNLINIAASVLVVVGIAMLCCARVTRKHRRCMVSRFLSRESLHKTIVGIVGIVAWMALVGLGAAYIRLYFVNLDLHHEGHVIQEESAFSLGRNVGKQEGYEAYAKKNNTELETIRKAQETLLRAQSQNSEKQGFSSPDFQREESERLVASGG